MLLSKSPHQIQKGFIPVLQELHVFGIKHFSAEKKTKTNKQQLQTKQHKSLQDFNVAALQKEFRLALKEIMIIPKPLYSGFVNSDSEFQIIFST